ncbi:InlB B-repeat-containing protein [Blautia sp. MSJ-19]|nr:InlB B-repeat-containing protein [Blautia sp. MSJ-19]
MRKIAAFLLTLAVVFSLICQADPQIFAQDLESSENEESGITVSSDEPVLSEEIQETENGETVQEEENLSEPEAGAEVSAEPETDATVPTESAQEAQVDVQSLYVITDPETHFTVTCNFYGTEDKSGNPVSTQILSETEQLQKPQTPAATGENADKKRFLGWFREDGTEFTAEDFAKNGAELAGKTDGKLNENVVINLVPKFSNVHYVYYRAGSEANDRILHTETFADGETILPTTESYGYKAEVGYVLIGWSADPAAEEPDAEHLIAETEGEFSLYPVVKKANWIRFASNGGTAVDPMLVYYGENSQEPTAPTKAGYTFAGWFTDAACTEAYVFGQTLDGDLTLYAGWKEGSASYKVIYWKETLTQGKYDYDSQTSGSDTTGKKISADTYGNKKSYDYFHYDSAASTQDVEIQGDGSTVLNVRYARNTYTFDFNLNGGRDYSGATMTIGGTTYTNSGTHYQFTARFGEYIADKWPTASNMDGNYSKYFECWYGGNSTSGNSSKRWNVTEQLISNKKDGTTQSYTGSWKNNLHTVTLHYWTQNVEDDNYTEIEAYTQKANTAASFIAKDIEGFVYNQSKDRHTGPHWNGQVTYYDDYNFYYDRKTYTLEFFNADGRQVKKVSGIRYEKSISDQNWTPERPAGLPEYMTVFAGWYTTPGCEDGAEFQFEGATMPASNLALYAKWMPKTITVTFVTGEGATSVDAQKLEANQAVAEPEDPTRANYKFVGWTTDEKGEHPFNFDQILVDDLTLYAQWANEGSYTLTYDANNSEGKAETLLDTERYAGGTKAKMIDVPDGWDAPEKSEGFLCWNTEADGSGEDYYPGNEFRMPEKDVILYAKWAKMRETTLIYDYNGGMENGQLKAQDQVEIRVPNGRYQIEKDAADVKKEGYYFAGWSTSVDGSDGVLLQKGEEIQVDTVDADTNILYAQWKPETPTPTGVADDPMPFATMSLAGMGMAALFLIPRRKRN